MTALTLPTGEAIPTLGLGTWQMGQSAAARAEEVAALRAGLDLGLTLIDTAEMYAGGGAEQVVADAIAGQRDKAFLVSKVMPQNASHAGTLKACEASLRRLKTDVIDLYLLHWRGGTPLAETVRAFTALQAAGKIRHWGVSNFDVSDLTELDGVPQGKACVANQVMYHAGSRGVEFDLLPQQQARHMPLMAYCPLGQGEVLTHPLLATLARKHGGTPATIAIAFLLSQPGVLPIPKTARPARVKELARARDIRLDAEDQAALDAAFPPPRRKQPLAMT